MSTRLALLVLVASFVASRAGAQVDPPPVRSGLAWEAQDLIGVPLATVTTPVLQTNQWYEIQTFDLDTGVPGAWAPDTVLAIRTSAWPEAFTLDGADGCFTPGETPQLERSCVRFKMDQSTGPVTLWIRAWDTFTRGRASIRFQQVSGPTASADPGQWQVLATDVPFGGLVVPNIGPQADGLLQLETGQLAGSTPFLSLTNVFVVPFDNNDINDNYYFFPNEVYPSSYPVRGESGSHRRQCGQTAEWTGWGWELALQGGTGNASGTVVAGVMNAGTGPFRVFRNDRVEHEAQPGSFVVAGVDADGDELGFDLENVLRSCDSTGSSSHVPACDTRPGCVAPLDAGRCAQSHRDSDEDGLRDDVEVYGFGPWFGPGGAYRQEVPLAAFGSSPGQYDVFVEVDYEATSMTTPPSGPLVPACAAGYGTGLIQPIDQAAGPGMAAIYRLVSSAGFPNRSGNPGIRLHFDSMLATGQSDVFGSVGNWGRSSCEGEACTSAADCPSGEGCQPEGVCTMNGSRARSTHLSPERRWLFRHLWVYEGCCGKAPVDGITGVAGGQHEALHEIAHGGGLSHGGVADPTLSADHLAYPSRVQYIWQNTGGRFDDADSAPERRVSFSEGLLGSLDPRALPETCPFGIPVVPGTPNDPQELFNLENLHTGRRSGPDSCPNWDWDGDGEIVPAGGTTQAQLWNGDALVIRDSYESGWLDFEGPAAVVVGGDLVRFHVESGHAVGNPVDQNILRLARHGLISCPSAPGPFGNMFPPCIPPNGPFAWLFDIDGPIRPDGVGAGVGAMPSGEELMIVVWSVSGSTGMRYATEGASTVGWAAHGPIPSAFPLSAPGNSRAPTLARIGGTSQVVLTYRDSFDRMIEQVGTPQANGDVSWSPGQVVFAPSGVTVAAAPTVTTIPPTSPIGGGAVAAVVVSDSSGLSVRIVRRAAAGGWSQVATLSPASLFAARPGLAFRPYEVGGATLWRLHLFTYRVVDGGSRVTLSDYDDIASWGSARSVTSEQGFGSEAAVLDQRGGAEVALRGIRSEAQTTPCSAPAPSWCPFGAVLAPVAWAVDTCVCRAPGGPVWGRRRLLPAIDGVSPMMSCDRDDWEQFRYSFCHGIRTLREEAPGGFDDDASTCVSEPPNRQVYCQ